MAIKGMAIRAAKDESRLKEICDFIWSLNFKKPVRVDIAYYENEAIRATVSKERYVVTVNPESKLEVIKNFLLQKGYISD